MSAISSSARPTLPNRLARPHLSLLLLAALFAVTFLVGVTGHPHTEHGLRKTADYLYTALLLPIAAVTYWALSELRRLQAGRDGRLGTLGIGLVGIALAGFFAAAAATLATGTTDHQGPLYPIAMAVSLIGFILFAIASVRARVLPRWVGPVLAAAWLVGGPAAPTPALMLVLVAALVATALTPARQRE